VSQTTLSGRAKAKLLRAEGRIMLYYQRRANQFLLREIGHPKNLFIPLTDQLEEQAQRKLDEKARKEEAAANKD